MMTRIFSFFPVFELSLSLPLKIGEGIGKVNAFPLGEFGKGLGKVGKVLFRIDLLDRHEHIKKSSQFLHNWREAPTILSIQRIKQTTQICYRLIVTEREGKMDAMAMDKIDARLLSRGVGAQIQNGKQHSRK